MKVHPYVAVEELTGDDLRTEDGLADLEHHAADAVADLCLPIT